jgi:DNA polymerase-3 subunit beta
MDVTIAQPTLHRALRLAARAVPPRPNLPILHAAVLEAGDGRLALTTTDLEVGVITSVHAEVARAGRVAAQARLLADFVAQLPAEPVRLTHDPAKPRLRVQCGRFTAGFATSDPADFPAIPPPDGAAALDLDAGRLREAIERVAFAAARDETRPVLTAVQLQCGAAGLTLAAADGFRLARARIDGVAASGTPPPEVLVPARAAAEIGRLLVDAQAAQLLLAPNGSGLHLRVRDTVLYARLVEGPFPDLDRVIPTEWRTRATVDAAALRQAVGVASLFGSATGGRPVRIQAAPGRLRLHASGDETGDADTELAAAIEGESQLVVLSTPLFAEVAAAARGKQIELAWSGPQSPMVVREVGREETADLWVVMPLYDPAVAPPQPTPAAPTAPTTRVAEPDVAAVEEPTARAA